MAIKYVPFYPDPVEGQAILDNFVRTRRMLQYRDNGRVCETLQRGMPLYEMDMVEHVGDNPDGNLVIRGECVSACAYLREQGIKVDLVYIDPPFASDADYAKKIYVRRNPKVAEAIAQAERELDNEELRAFEDVMYGDVWDKERYLNWMYENLMAIKSIMSETGSIYVHLDWHIVHYVKILLDEIFGESNFRNDIAWHYSGWNKKLKTSFEKRHDTILYYCLDEEGRNFHSYFLQWESEDEYIRKRKQKPLTDQNGRRYVLSDAGSGKRLKRYIDEAVSEGVVVDDVWDIDKINNSANESFDYTTQKPVALLERVVMASSDEGMLVADFFGGSGVTAAVAHKLGRRFIDCDINLNSIQTTRDRLCADGAQFDVMEVRDGVSLYRNPAQTMQKLKSLIVGLRNEDALGKFWGGAFQTASDGMIPVYLPNLMDGTTRLLDKRLMAQLLFEVMPDLPQGVKKIVVFYVDVEDLQDMQAFIRENNDTEIEIELRDLKAVLDNVVAEDYADFAVTTVQDTLLTEYKVTIERFASDRVQSRIDKYNDVGIATAMKNGKEFAELHISENGLEMIEFISIDCTNGDKDTPWQSDAEIKIDNNSFVIRNGVKTKEFWDGTICCEKRPLRVKIRNICGDESVWEVQ